MTTSVTRSLFMRGNYFVHKFAKKVHKIRDTSMHMSTIDIHSKAQCLERCVMSGKKASHETSTDLDSYSLEPSSPPPVKFLICEEGRAWFDDRLRLDS